MEDHAHFITLGCLLLIGLAADQIGRKTRIPRVTLLILFGFAVGPSGFVLLPSTFQEWFGFLSTLALTMVAFLLGGKLSTQALQENGKAIFIISFVVVIVTLAVVGAGLMLIGASAIVALLLAGIATATDPAATQDVVRQEGADGPFTRTLLGIVAIDDAWGLMAFSVCLALAKAIDGDGNAAIIGVSLWEVGGAVVVGFIIGVPSAFLTGRLKAGEPVQAEALGIVFLCAGVAMWLEVSFLLAAMVAGAVIVNFASHHEHAFHEIEHIEWPFMILFFVLAGASFQFASLELIGAIGIAYIGLRVAARFLGGWIGCSIARSSRIHRAWMGPALVPQAGVALGMALIAGATLPETKDILLTTVIGTTIVFELVGPIMTQVALGRVGEAGKA